MLEAVLSFQNIKFSLIDGYSSSGKWNQIQSNAVWGFTAQTDTPLMLSTYTVPD